jgi:protein-disulfide isomerase
MQTRTQRGRLAKSSRPSSAHTITALVAILIILGAIVAAVAALQPRPAAGVPGVTTIAAPGVPTSRNPEGFYVKGNPDAPVVVTEYVDFQCPGCGYYARSLAQGFEQDYVATGKVLFVFHEYPLEFHANAIPAAEAARCAGDQGKFWEMYGLLFDNQRQWSDLNNPGAQFGTYAGQLGLDTGAFGQCSSSGVNRAAILAARDTGTRLGIKGTPSFAVNGALVDTTGAQSVDEIALRVRAAVDAALAAN